MAVTIYHNIKQLLTLEGAKQKDGRKVLREDLGILENAWIAVENNIIKATGTGKPEFADKTVDLNKSLVMPCFIDSHTHVTYAGSRHNEFEMRAQGKTYLEIAKAGGGIISTVNKTRSANIDELKTMTLNNINRMKKFGVGFIEAKSGYGLDIDTEIKQLKAIKEASKEFPFIRSTFLGAHDIPPGEGNKDKRKKEYIDVLTQGLIKEVADKKLATFCDVFLEDGYYDQEETKYIINHAKKHGLIPKLHADEFTDQNGARLAVELGAISADHLLCISDKGIEALANSETVATILPGTSFNLGLKYAPAKKMIEAGACVAIASDFNPGSNAGLNFQLILTIAVTQNKISVAQAICAGCYGGAKALGIQQDFGHLSKGAKAVLQVYDAENYSEIFYNYGENKLKDLIWA